MKDIGFDKDRLVTEKRPHHRANASQYLLPELYHPETPVVEPPMKGPAYYLFLSGHCCQSFEMFVPQFGVRMVKAKKKPACFTRTGIQLRPARGPLTSDQTDLAAMLQFSQYLGGFDRGHHPFGSPRVERDAIYQLGNKIVPHRNDEAD